MNKTLLALYGLKWNPFSAELPLEALHARGKTYVEAAEGREYSIRLTNHTGQRVAAALAVDGLNSIDAKTTTARKASKWIVGPWQTVTISGWQTGPGRWPRWLMAAREPPSGIWSTPQTPCGRRTSSAPWTRKGSMMIGNPLRDSRSRPTPSVTKW